MLTGAIPIPTPAQPRTEETNPASQTKTSRQTSQVTEEVRTEADAEIIQELMNEEMTQEQVVSKKSTWFSE